MPAYDAFDPQAGGLESLSRMELAVVMQADAKRAGTALLCRGSPMINIVFVDMISLSADILRPGIRPFQQVPSARGY